jgi:hypothetical protein
MAALYVVGFWWPFVIGAAILVPIVLILARADADATPAASV